MHKHTHEEGVLMRAHTYRCTETHIHLRGRDFVKGTHTYTHAHRMGRSSAEGTYTHTSPQARGSGEGTHSLPGS